MGPSSYRNHSRAISGSKSSLPEHLHREFSSLGSKRTFLFSFFPTKELARDQALVGQHGPHILEARAVPW